MPPTLLPLLLAALLLDSGSFTPPTLTDEDIQGQDVPGYLACDACRAVVDHAHRALRQAERDGGGAPLGEAAVMQLLEERVCQFSQKQLLVPSPPAASSLSSPQLAHPW